jgi:uncharacterized protein (TIGR02117 family)
MRKLARRSGWGLAGLFVVVGLATVLTARAGDPALWPPAADKVAAEIFVVSHGYHAGIAVSRPALAEIAGRHGHAALIAVAQRFSDYAWIEIGWGDEGFYTSVPQATSLTFAMAAPALFRPGNASVLHVVGLTAPPCTVFPAADIVQVDLSANGVARMMEQLERSFTRTGEPALPQALGPGLYGPSLFYRSVDTFHLFNVCNHWVARLLSAAGLPIAPVLATVPPGLLFDLKWRSGLRTLPAHATGVRS